jgi:hypothetical protein
MRTYLTRYGLWVCAVWVAGAACSCQDGGRWGRSPTTAEADSLALLMPTKIKIHSFTKVKPLFGGGIPNGVEVWLEPLDRFGDVVKIVGELHFELYSYKSGSADHKGEQLEFWQVRIATPAEQQRHWDRVARMYRFPLAWDYAPPPGKKYILLATYQLPNGERLTDERELLFELDREKLRESGGSSERP